MEFPVGASDRFECRRRAQFTCANAQLCACTRPAQIWAPVHAACWNFDSLLCRTEGHASLALAGSGQRCGDLAKSWPDSPQAALRWSPVSALSLQALPCRISEGRPDSSVSTRFAVIVRKTMLARKSPFATRSNRWEADFLRRSTWPCCSDRLSRRTDQRQRATSPYNLQTLLVSDDFEVVDAGSGLTFGLSAGHKNLLDAHNRRRVNPTLYTSAEFGKRLRGAAWRAGFFNRQGSCEDRMSHSRGEPTEWRMSSPGQSGGTGIPSSSALKPEAPTTDEVSGLLAPEPPGLRMRRTKASASSPGSTSGLQRGARHVIGRSAIAGYRAMQSLPCISMP